MTFWREYWIEREPTFYQNIISIMSHNFNENIIFKSKFIIKTLIFIKICDKYITF